MGESVVLLLIVSVLLVISFFTLILTFYISLRTVNKSDLSSLGGALLKTLVFDHQPGAFTPIVVPIGSVLCVSTVLLYVFYFLLTGKVSSGDFNLFQQVMPRVVNVVGFLFAWSGMGYCLNGCTLAYRNRTWGRLVYLSGATLVCFLFFFAHMFSIRGRRPSFLDPF